MLSWLSFYVSYEVVYILNAFLLGNMKIETKKARKKGAKKKARKKGARRRRED
jgi:hypothetical protein